MADIAPFRGILFDPKRVDLTKVIAPPYDVIDAAQRAQLAGADPHNVVRLILPEADGGGDRYQAAAKTLDAWLGDGTLRRDDSRAVYRYHQRFRLPDGDREVTRRGVVCGIRLQPYSDGVIRPHERTLKAPKEDRAKLLAATRTHFSQVFGLFSDAAGEVERLFRKHDYSPPDLRATTADGVEHLLWRVADATLIGRLRHTLAPKKVYIADGHHRYETMLAMRDELVAAHDCGTYSAAQYGSIFLASMDDPGVVILPTHRVVHGLASFSRDELLTRAREYFIVDRLAGAAGDVARVRDAIAQSLAHRPAFAAVFPNDPDAWVLTLAPNVTAMAVGLAGHPSVLRLDVTLLHGLMLERILGITPAAQESETNVRYVRDAGAALKAVQGAGAQVAFLMGAPRMADVRQVADAGEVMPQKSTNFYPKLASGMVMNRIDPNEDLI